MPMDRMQFQPGLSIAAFLDRYGTLALVRLIDDAGLRQRMGMKGRQRAEHEFSTRRVAQETLALVPRIGGSAAGRG